MRRIRFGIYALAMACVLALAGCGSRGKTSSQAATAENEPAPQEEAAPPAEASKYAVTIDGARLVEDYSGNPAIAIDYTFTNVSDEDATSMAVAVYPEVYQGGTQCDTAIAMDIDTGGYMSKVKAGSSVPVTLVYELRDTENNVDVEVKELFSWDDTMLAQASFVLAEL